MLQRVIQASVHVNEKPSGPALTGAIGTGILALIAVEKGDTETQADRLLQRMLAYRIFEDDEGRMNLDLRQAGGQLLLVSQFTLAADTNKGNRPSFSLASARRELGEVPCGRFGAHMQVSLVNDGPVTFSLRVPPPGSR